MSLAGPKAGKSETLGIILRTSTDGHVLVWRVTDPLVRGVMPGDRVLAVNVKPVRARSGHSDIYAIRGMPRRASRVNGKPGYLFTPGAASACSDAISGQEMFPFFA